MERALFVVKLSFLKIWSIKQSQPTFIYFFLKDFLALKIVTLLKPHTSVCDVCWYSSNFMVASSKFSGWPHQEFYLSFNQWNSVSFSSPAWPFEFLHSLTKISLFPQSLKNLAGSALSNCFSDTRKKVKNKISDLENTAYPRKPNNSSKNSFTEKWQKFGHSSS